MKFNYLFLLIVFYLIAFSTNFMSSIKYPDANITIFNFLATVLFVLILLKYTKEKLNAKKDNKKLKIFLLVGVITGVLVYVIKMFENFMFDYAFLDAIATIQYPIYLIFITPLFGANLLLNLSSSTFSLFMSLFYIFTLFYVVSFKKEFPFKLRSSK